jgi:hypothetical protein
MFLLDAQVEDLINVFDSIQNKHMRIDAALFNNDGLYKEVINEVR